MRRFLPILKLLLVLAALAFIWGHSLAPAELSSQESEWFLNLVRPVVTAVGRCLERFGVSVMPSVLVRKLAHFSEYAVLGALMYLLFSTPQKRSRGFLPAAACLGTAVVDEFLQRFAAGRAPALRDVGIDFAGACLGILLTAAILALPYHILIRHKNRINGESAGEADPEC